MKGCGAYLLLCVLSAAEPSAVAAAEASAASCEANGVDVASCNAGAVQQLPQQQVSQDHLLLQQTRLVHSSGDEEGDAPAGVFIMLPLDTISSEGKLNDREGLALMLDKMTETGVDGFMVDVWWGVTEGRPREYNFVGYKELFEMARARGWKVQAVASFHRCGGNVGDSCNIPLPDFVVKAEGIWYTDADGVEDREYISLFADEIQVGGRTPLQMYSDWMEAFGSFFAQDLGTLITEVMVGMGPCGELRFPSYPLDRWSFCGVGQFQAFDPHALVSLKEAASGASHPEWSSPPGPASAGGYNSAPFETEFFTEGYQTDYGQFFLDWYSGSLKAHGKRVLGAARAAFKGKVQVTGKVAGIHWWYDTEAHAAETTAGYYNTNLRNFYEEVAGIFAAEGAALDFTCMEMRNSEQPARCKSNPEGLVQQAITAAKKHGLSMGGENALLRYDHVAYDKMLSYRGQLAGLSFLRLTEDLVSPQNIGRFTEFVKRFHA